MAGWIKLWRQIQEHRYWQKEREFSEFEALIDLLFRAAYEPEIRDGVMLERGEFADSYEVLATRWGWSRSSVCRFFQNSRRAGELETRIAKNGNAICNAHKLVNYERYQCVNSLPGETVKRKMKRDNLFSETLSISLRRSKKEDPPPTPPRTETIEFPAGLDTEAFRAAWGDWLTHKAERRDKLTTIGKCRQLSRLAKWGEARAIAAIEHSIENGWAGIFEEKKSASAPSQFLSAAERREQREKEMIEKLKREQSAMPFLLPGAKS